MVLDAEAPYQLTATILTRPVAEALVRRVTVLMEKEGPLVQRILDQLEKDDYETAKCGPADEPQAGQDVLPLLDIEKPFFHGIDEATFKAFKPFLLGLQEKGAGMPWATHLGEIGCKDPRYAQVLGFARAVRTEQLAELATCQVYHFDSPESTNRLLQVLAKFQSRSRDD